MKIGIFDSGLGGLIIMRQIIKALPQYDFVYLGDSLRVPYGPRSSEAIYNFTRQAVDYLFRKQPCQLVIIACNTAASQALRKIQRVYLKRLFPDRRVLGVIVPTLEAVIADNNIQRLGALVTVGTARSNVYGKELKKLKPHLKFFQQAAPLLVPLIESGEKQWYGKFVGQYLKPLLKAQVQSIVLGCTHYPILKQEIKKRAKNVKIFSQDEIIPPKLKDYLKRHPEIETKLSKQHRREILLTDLTPENQRIVKRFFGNHARVKKVVI
jgi:glutamate racemase